MESLIILIAFVFLVVIVFLYSAYRKLKTDYRLLELDYIDLIKKNGLSTARSLKMGIVAGRGGNPHPKTNPIKKNPDQP